MSFISLVNLNLFPLQVAQGIMETWQNRILGYHVRSFVIGLSVIIAILIIAAILKQVVKLPSFNESQAALRIPKRKYSFFYFNRIANSLSLSGEQAKMLDFVLRNDGSTDPARSVNTAALLDRHFKKAYYEIEKTSKGEDELAERLAVLFATRNIIENNIGSAVTTSTRQIPENLPALLVVKSAAYPIRVISARGDSLVVENPKNDTGEPLRLAKGAKVELSFFEKSSKGFSVNTRVLGATATADGPVMQLLHSGQIKRLSNRRFRRRKTGIVTSFFFVTVEEDDLHKSKKLTLDDRRFSGNILDISIGGCSMQTNIPVNSGQMVKVEFTREDSSVVTALGEVLRTNRTGMSTILHIRFLKVPRKSLNKINAMVYEYNE